MSNVKIRFNAAKHHVYVVGDLEMHGGDTATVTEEQADVLARDPEIEIVGGRSRGRTQPDTEAGEAAGETTKEE